MRQVEGTETQSGWDPHPTQGDPQVGGDHSHGGPPWGLWGLNPTLGSPAWGTCTQEDKPPLHFALKTSKAYVWESQSAIGNQDSALKGHSQKLTHSKSQCRGSSLKTAWVICKGDSLATFRACVRGTGNCWNFRQGQRCWWAPYFFFCLTST